MDKEIVKKIDQLANAYQLLAYRNGRVDLLLHNCKVHNYDSACQEAKVFIGHVDKSWEQVKKIKKELEKV
jgi:hypothetical protein